MARPWLPLYPCSSECSGTLTHTHTHTQTIIKSTQKHLHFNKFTQTKGKILKRTHLAEKYFTKLFSIYKVKSSRIKDWFWMLKANLKL